MKSCHNCKYLVRDSDRFYNRCKRIRTRDGQEYQFTGIVLDFPYLYQSCTNRDYIHWAPKVSLIQRLRNLFTSLFK
jgi:hypothetical protein